MSLYLILAIESVEVKEYQKAILYAKKCIDIAKETGDQRAELKAYLVLGDAYNSLQQYDDAILYSKKCIDIAKESDDQRAEMNAYLALGDAYNSLQQYDDAILYSKKRIDLAKESGDQHAEMKAYLVMGDAYNSIQQYDDAVFYIKKCIDISKESGDQNLEMKAYLLLGAAYNSLQQYDDAILYSKKCVDIAKETGDQRAEMNAYVVLVQAYTVISITAFENSLIFAKEGIKIAEKYGNDEKIKRFRCELISIYQSLNMDDKSLKLPYELENAEYSTRKDEREDYETLKDNLDQARQTNDVLEKSNALHKLTEYHISKQGYDMAIKCEKERLALDLGHGLNDEKNTKCFINIASILYKEMGRYDEALQHYHDGLACAKKCNDKELQSDCCASLGDIYCFLNQRDKAKKLYTQAIECREYIFVLLSQDEHQINIVDKYVEWYKIVSFIHLEDGEVERALEFAERCRARALRQRLFTAQGRKQEEAGKDYQLQYSDVISTTRYSILFYILFPYMMSIILIQKGEILAHPLAKIDENEMKSLIDECYDDMGVVRIKW